jgi:hypothetical protein
MSEQEQNKAEEEEVEQNTDQQTEAAQDAKTGCMCGVNKEMCEDIVQSLKTIDYQGLFARILLLITRPQEAWGVVRNEKLSIKDIYIQHLVVLIAASAVVNFINLSIIGISTPIGTYRQGFFGGLFYMVLSFVVALVLVYAASLLIEFIGKLEFFGSKADTLSFFKLVGYSMIPGLIGSILGIVPMLGIVLTIGFALYGIYVMYLGVEPITGISNKEVYLVTAVLSLVVLYAVLFGLLGVLMPSPSFS